MLRNRLQGQIVGLVGILVIGCSVTGCSSSNDQRHLRLNLVVKADPYYEYKLRNILETSLKHDADKLHGRMIRVTVTEKEEQAAFSEREALTEGKRITAHVELLDGNYNTLFETRLDSFSTYGVSDEFPYSGISAQRSVTDDMLQDIGNAISTALSAFTSGCPTAMSHRV